MTGAAGFIGSHLVDRLLESGHEVIGFDNFSNGTIQNLTSASEKETFSLIEADVLNFTDCRSACRKIDVVFHLACLGVRHSLHSPKENHLVNAEGTLNMLEASKRNSVQQFFYISSSEVYGKVEQFPITERAVPVPITVYGSSKLAGEHYTNSYRECFGLNTAILRIFNNYGPRAHFEGDSGELIPRTIVNFLNGNSATVFGDGNFSRDFYYVGDTATVLTSMIGNRAIQGGLFNLGTSCEIKIIDVIQLIAEIMAEYKPKIEYLPERPADVPRLWVDNRKISSLLDINPNTSFSEGLRKTIAYYTSRKANGDLTYSVPDTNWQLKGIDDDPHF